MGRNVVCGCKVICSFVLDGDDHIGKRSTYSRTLKYSAPLASFLIVKRVRRGTRGPHRVHYQLPELILSLCLVAYNTVIIQLAVSVNFRIFGCALLSLASDKFGVWYIKGKEVDYAVATSFLRCGSARQFWTAFSTSLGMEELSKALATDRLAIVRITDKRRVSGLPSAAPTTSSKTGTVLSSTTRGILASCSRIAYSNRNDERD